MALLRVAVPDPPVSDDARAYGRLWDAHAGAIYRYCFHRTGEAALAEDLTSIVFLEAWRRRRHVVLAPGAALPWLYGVATNVLRNQHRSRRRYGAALARLPVPEDEPDFADGVAERIDDERRMGAILDQLRELSDLEQEVLSLCVWEGLPLHEVARALDVPEATVRTRLHRARQHLRSLTPPNARVPDPTTAQGDRQ
jgi:RNA polymerase sigma factor (sigma-70 family)